MKTVTLAVREHVEELVDFLISDPEHKLLFDENIATLHKNNHKNYSWWSINVYNILANITLKQYEKIITFLNSGE